MKNSENLEISSKICTKCEDELPIQYFYKDRTRKGGYRSICKSCLASYPSYRRGFHSRGHVSESEMTGKLKSCSKCGERKDRAYFPVDRTKLDGRKSACKECRKKDWQNYRERRKLQFDSDGNSSGSKNQTGN